MSDADDKLQQTADAMLAGLTQEMIDAACRPLLDWPDDTEGRLARMYADMWGIPVEAVSIRMVDTVAHPLVAREWRERASEGLRAITSRMHGVPIESVTVTFSEDGEPTMTVKYPDLIVVDLTLKQGRVTFDGDDKGNR